MRFCRNVRTILPCRLLQVVIQSGLTTPSEAGIIGLTLLRRLTLINNSQNHDKGASLRRYHALHPRPQRVRDPAFTSDNPFFDPRTLGTWSR